MLKKSVTGSLNRKRALFARSIAVVCGFAFTAPQAASAATYYWDTNGTAIGFGTTASTWAAPTPGPTAGWTTDSSGVAAIGSVTTTTTDDLFFGSTAWVPSGTVTVSGTVDAGNLNFAAGTTITFSTNTINLAAASNINSKSFNTTTISSILSGAGTSLTKNGFGALVLQGANTYTGATILNGNGTVTLSGAAGGINISSGITFNGGTLTLTNAAAQGAVDRLNNSAASLITSNSGTLNYGNANTAANTYTETAGTLALTTGQFNTVLTTNLSTADGQTLTFGGLTHTGASNTSAVTFSANTTGPQSIGNKNMIVVTGGGTTAANQIIGPWATVGVSAASQTDYAVYNANYVVPANITDSLESTWLTSTNSYTTAGSTSLTGNRTMAALRNTGASATISLSDGVNGFTLATNGILNGVGSLLTIDPGAVAGSLTAPGVSGGQIHINAGAGAIAVTAPLNDNGGNVTLVKNGNGVLTLSNAANAYSGGTVINAGTLSFTNGALGTTGNITINGGVTASVSASFGKLQWASGNSQDISSRLAMVNGGNANLDTNGNNVSFANSVGSGTSSSFTKVGTGQLTFNANNTYTGETGVYAGTLLINAAQTNTTSIRVGLGGLSGAIMRLGLNNAFPTNVPVMVDGSSVNTLDLNGFNQTVGHLSLGSNNGGAQGTVSGSGSSTLTLTAGVTVDGHNNGAGLISVPFLDLNGVTQNFAIVGSNNATSNLTISSVIQNGGIIRTGTSLVGALILSGANTFSGPTTNAIGMLRLDNALALQNSPFDTTGSVAGSANGGLRINTGVTTLTLGGLTGNKDFAATGGVITTATGGYGTLTDLTLNPGVSQSYSYSGVIADGATGMTLTKTGAGTQTLAGTNTYTGATNVNAGILTLDYSTLDSTKLTDTSVLVFGGGTLNLSGGTHTELVASTTINPGSSSVTRSSGTAILALGAITPVAGGIVNFDAANIATTTNTNTNGILGTWATVGGANWAANDGANNIVAYTAYTDVQRLTPGTIADGSATNVRLVEGSGAAGNILLGSATTTINTLNQSTSGGSSAATINPAGQTLATNAILIGPGAGTLTIGTGVNNGTLMTATVGGDLSLINNSVNGLTINSVIANNTSSSSFTKTGTGAATLTAANTYTGATTVSGGTLNLTGSLGGGGAITINSSGVLSESSTGVISGGASITHSSSGTSTLSGVNTYTGGTTLSAGTLQLGNASAIGTGPLTISGGSLDSSVVNLVNANNNLQNWNGNFAFVGTQNLNLGTGAVTLNANIQTTVSANTLTVGGDIGGGAFRLTKAGAGTLNLSGSNTYTGLTTVSGGTLNVTGGISTIGSLAIGSASYQQSGINTSVTLTGTTEMNIGTTGTGTFTLNGGTFSVQTSSPTVAANIGANGAGVFNQTGGLFSFAPTGANLLLNIGVALTGGSAIVNLSGGTFQTASNVPVYLGGRQTTNMNISGTALVDVPNLIFNRNLSVAHTATMNLGNGTPGSGTLKVSSIIKESAAANNVAIFNFNGGLLQAGVSTPTFMAGLTTANVRNGGAKIDTNTFDITIGQALLHSTIGGDNAIDGGLVKSGLGILTLTGNNTYTGGTTVSAGTLQVGDGGATGNLGTGAVVNNAALVVNRTGTLTTAAISGTGNTTVTAASATLTANHVRQAGLDIGATNTVTVAPNGSNSGVSQVTNLTIAAGGKLDLKNNDLIVPTGTLTRAQVETLVNSGKNTMTGILTTSASGITGLGTAQIGETVYAGSGTYGGLTVVNADTLVKYTYLGDADLSGAVDFDDYAFIDAGFFGGGNRWAQGDFDNNGAVDFDDYAFIDGSFFGQGAPLLTANISAVPEPSTWVLGGLAMLGLAGVQLRRRRLAV